MNLDKMLIIKIIIGVVLMSSAYAATVEVGDGNLGTLQVGYPPYENTTFNAYQQEAYANLSGCFELHFNVTGSDGNPLYDYECTLRLESNQATRGSRQHRTPVMTDGAGHGGICIYIDPGNYEVGDLITPSITCGNTTFNGSQVLINHRLIEPIMFMNSTDYFEDIEFNGRLLLEQEGGEEYKCTGQILVDNNKTVRNMDFYYNRDQIIARASTFGLITDIPYNMTIYCDGYAFHHSQNFTVSYVDWPRWAGKALTSGYQIIVLLGALAIVLLFLGGFYYILKVHYFER